MMRIDGMKRRLTVAALVLASAACVWVLLGWPVFFRFDPDRAPGRKMVTGLTYWQLEGVRGAAIALLPVSLTLVALLYPRQWVRIVAAVVLPVFAIVSGFSIGLFYAPAALLMLLAACVDDSARLRDAF
jgi:hypothetical protein